MDNSFHRKHKRSEEQAKLLASAVEQTLDGIAVVDLDGNILKLNKAFAKMHGYSEKELTGKNLSIFHVPEQMPAVIAANKQIKETGEFIGEIWHVRRNGTAFPTLMHNSLLHDKSGKLIGKIGTCRDISDLKQAEKALSDAHETLEKQVEKRTFELLKSNNK